MSTHAVVTIRRSLSARLQSPVRIHRTARVSMSSFTSIGRLVTIVLLVGLASCTVHPPGEREERATAVQMGKPFEKRIEVRQIQPLPENPTPDQLVEYALLSNAELE